MHFVVTVALLTAATCAHAQTTATFENATLNQPLPGPNTFQNGSTLSPLGSFSTVGLTFNNYYDAGFDYWSGWSYSNVKDVSTPGFGNQFAAYNLPGAGSGDGSDNYAVASVGFPADPTITTSATSMNLSSIRITNTTYAALSMLNGDSFAKKFGGSSGNDPDFFLLTIKGFDASNVSTGSVDFYLADYRFADNSLDYIIDRWTTVDLSGFAAGTKYLSFGLTSSDNSFGFMNTPAYFAADNFMFAPVPEPSAMLLASFVSLAAFGMQVLRNWRGRIS